MSLIDEALRRAQAAQTGGSGGRDFRVPMPLPDPGRYRRGRLLRFVAVAVLAAIAIGAGIFLLGRGRGARPPSRAASAARRPSIAALASAVLPTPTLPVVEVAAPPSGISHPPKTAPTARPSPPEKIAMVVADRTPRSTPGPEPSRAREIPAPELSNASGSPRIGKKPELGGIVYSEGSPSALINGRVVRPGGYIDGYTVVRIEPNFVELRDGNGTIILTLK